MLRVFVRTDGRSQRHKISTRCRAQFWGDANWPPTQVWMAEQMFKLIARIISGWQLNSIRKRHKSLKYMLSTWYFCLVNPNRQKSDFQALISQTNFLNKINSRLNTEHLALGGLRASKVHDEILDRSVLHQAQLSNVGVAESAAHHFGWAAIAIDRVDNQVPVDRLHWHAREHVMWIDWFVASIDIMAC